MARFSILMCVDGTYPYYHGGVSVWCDQMVQSIDADFQVFAITHAPNRTPVFKLPPNVTDIRAVSLWGTPEPGWSDASFLKTYQRKARTTRAVIRNRFLRIFSETVDCLLRRGRSPERLGKAFLELHLYFAEFDYAKSMTSPEAWEVFLQACERGFPDSQKLTIDDVTTCMRWLQRFLGVLAVPLPKTEITHSSIASLAGVAGVLKKLLHGSPFLLTEHGIYLRELYLGLMRSGYSEACRRFLACFNEAIVRMNYHFADVITALGSFNKAWQIRLGAPEGRICIVPNGIDPKRFRPVVKTEARPVVMTLARIYPIKGIEFLLRAAAIVRKKVPSVLFRVLGEPADLKYYQCCQQIVADERMEETVEFGVTNDPPSALAAADVFCLPSVSEGMPYSILEAMFSGRTVVASDVGNVAEMLEGTGLLVPPADPDALARALVSVLEGEGAEQYRKSLVNAALKRAHSLYTIEQSMNRFRDLYESLLCDKHNTRLHIAAC
jgi:polysaccharide biosynthesis protein PelF